MQIGVGEEKSVRGMVLGLYLSFHCGMKFLHRGGIDARSVIGPLRLSSKGNDLALVWKGRTGSRHASGFLV